MIPILYDYFERDFTSAGIGRLEECISCTVNEVINGEYECEFVYPITGKWFDRLVNLGCLIAVTHDHNGDIQPFEVYRYSAPIDGVVTFNAHHISYRLSNAIVGPTGVTGASNPEESFELMTRHMLTQDVFSFFDYSEYPSTVGSPDSLFFTDIPASVRDLLLDENREFSALGSEALVKLYPGEFRWDKFNVEYYRKRGSNKGLQIRYSKNMSDVTRERDVSETVSAVIPYWVKDATVIYGTQVNSPNTPVIVSSWDYTSRNASNGAQMTTPSGEQYYFGAADIRVAAVDFSEYFGETQPDEDQLKQAALDWMRKNATWQIYDNITVNFVDLYNSADYADVKEIEKCAVGDFVDVYYTALGIVSKDVEIVSGTFDVLADSFIEMELNDIKTTYADVIYNMIEGSRK